MSVSVSGDQGRERGNECICTACLSVCLCAKIEVAIAIAMDPEANLDHD